MNAAQKNEARGFRLHHHAPEVPEGLRPREGVKYGCGDPHCRDCYEPEPANESSPTTPSTTEPHR